MEKSVLWYFFVQYLGAERNPFILLPPANEVCEGYVFTGVCLSTGGGGDVRASRGVRTSQGGVVAGRHVWLGVCVVVGGMHGCRGVCGCRRGIHCCGGHAWLQGGGHAWDMMRYGQWAGGMRPTGMHSCFVKF